MMLISQEESKETKLIHQPSNHSVNKTTISAILLIIFAFFVYIAFSSFQITDSIEQQQLECIEDTGSCYETTLSRVIDGDTLEISELEYCNYCLEPDLKLIRFSLSSAPELSDPGGAEAKEFIEEICPIGSKLIIDEDDKQMQGSYGRVIAKVTCNGMNLNEYLIESEHGSIDTIFCNTSEFAQESWAKECN